MRDAVTHGLALNTLLVLMHRGMLREREVEASVGAALSTLASAVDVRGLGAAAALLAEAMDLRRTLGVAAAARIRSKAIVGASSSASLRAVRRLLCFPGFDPSPAAGGAGVPAQSPVMPRTPGGGGGGGVVVDGWAGQSLEGSSFGIRAVGMLDGGALLLARGSCCPFRDGGGGVAGGRAGEDSVLGRDEVRALEEDTAAFIGAWLSERLWAPVCRQVAAGGGNVSGIRAIRSLRPLRTISGGAVSLSPHSLVLVRSLSTHSFVRSLSTHSLVRSLSTRSFDLRRRLN